MSTPQSAPPPSDPCTEDARRLQAVLDALPVPIFFKDAAGRYLGFNVAFERGIGMPRARLLGRTVLDIAPPDLAEVYRKADDALLQGGGVQVYEAQVAWGDGSRRDVVFHKAILADADGRTVGLVGAMLDVSDQRAAERSQKEAVETVRAAQRLAALGTLAAGVAHELNNPLTYVLSNVEMVADAVRRLRGTPPEAEGWDEALHALDDALEGAERMRIILRDLRTLARPDDRVSGSVDVRAVLEHAAAVASIELRGRARLVWDVGDVPAVRGTDGRLGQVFMNLLVNAAHAIPEGNPDAQMIRLSAARHGEGGVVIAVQDTGVGIPAENLLRVFDPFFTTKPAGLGTGLGLWVCQNIVTTLGGRIEVESEVGRGTTFRVHLPAAEAEPARAGLAAPGVAPRWRVLVVDDEPLVAAAVRRQLAPDHEVDAASGAADALGRLAACKFDAVICDVGLEGASGVDLLEQIRRRDPELGSRVLLVTGGMASAVAERVERCGARCLHKPFGRRQLREALQPMLAR
ncbi:MAG TPA: ATP-binding protein [Anaeromyxobacter sp.]